MAFCFAAASAFAADGVVVRESEIRSGAVDEADAAASEWGITTEDYARYRELMRGRRGVWSPEADPLLVLGAHARSAEERRRIAEAFVVAEHARVEGELAFEREVQAAWTRLFPGQRRVGLGAEGRVAVRFAVLVERDCGACAPLVARYAERGVPVDFYVAGAAGDGDLRRWIAEQAIEAGAVRPGQVTVNHSNGSVPGEAPAVWGVDDALNAVWYAVQVERDSGAG